MGVMRGTPKYIEYFRELSGFLQLDFTHLHVSLHRDFKRTYSSCVHRKLKQPFITFQNWN